MPGTPHLTPVARAATARSSSTSSTCSRTAAAAPRDDLMTKMVTADIDGEPFVPDEITPVSEISGLMMILFLGGVESTAGLTGTLFKLLAENPDQRALLLARPVADPGRRRGGHAADHAAAAHRPHDVARGHPARRHDPGGRAGRAGARRRQPRRAPVPRPRPVRPHPAARAGTSGSARASTAASAPRSPGWRRGSRWRRRCPSWASTSSRARPASTNGTTTHRCEVVRSTPAEQRTVRDGRAVSQGDVNVSRARVITSASWQGFPTRASNAMCRELQISAET